MTPTRFCDLAIGQAFDWIDDSRPGSNSFFKRCVRVSARCYQDEDQHIHRVGSVKVKVHHVTPRYQEGN